MTSEHLDDPLPLELVVDPTACVRTALDRAYKLVSESHDPELGFDGLTFGIAVARVGWFQIEAEVEATTGLQSFRPNNSFLIIDEDGRTYRVYRGGDSVDWDVYLFDFDGSTETKAAGARINSAQLQFEFAEAQTPEDVELVSARARELYFIHAGNPQQGLTALYLGSPYVDSLTGKSKWGWVRRVWKRDTEFPAEGAEERRPHFEPFDRLAEPELTVRVHPDAGESEASATPSE